MEKSKIDIGALIEKAIKENGPNVTYVDFDSTDGYFIYYSGPKERIQIKKGVFTYKYYLKYGDISANFKAYDENNYILINEYIKPLTITKKGRVMVLDKKDIDEGISMVKDYLKERYTELKKEYDDRLDRFKNAIESEVKYDIC